MTGLTGRLARSVKLSANGREYKYIAGSTFTIRWDWDDDKLSHVNLHVVGSSSRRVPSYHAAIMCKYQNQYWTAIREFSGWVQFRPAGRYSEPSRYRNSPEGDARLLASTLVERYWDR